MRVTPGIVLFIVLVLKADFLLLEMIPCPALGICVVVSREGADDRIRATVAGGLGGFK